MSRADEGAPLGWRLERHDVDAVNCRRRPALGEYLKVAAADPVLRTWYIFGAQQFGQIAELQLAGSGFGPLKYLRAVLFA